MNTSEFISLQLCYWNIWIVDGINVPLCKNFVLEKPLLQYLKYTLSPPNPLSTEQSKEFKFDVVDVGVKHIFEANKV